MVEISLDEGCYFQKFQAHDIVKKMSMLYFLVFIDLKKLLTSF